MRIQPRNANQCGETLETVSYALQSINARLKPCVNQSTRSRENIRSQEHTRHVSPRRGTLGAGLSLTPNFSWVWRDQQHVPNCFNNLIHGYYEPVTVSRRGLGRTLRDLLLLSLSAVLIGTAFAGLKTGEAFPALSSFKLEGNLPDTGKAKVVMVDFWASWCEPCKQSFPVMEDLHRRYGKDGLVIIAVNVDENRADMEAFLKKNAVTFALLRDANQKLVERAGVATMPTSFLIDKDGRVRFLHNGFRGAETKKKYDEEIQSLLK
jgi:thiol-disulfide isomerase/thioredoxin